MWYLKKKTKEYIKQNRKRLTEIENKLVVPNGKMEVGGAGWGRELRGTNYRHYV